MTIDSNSKSQSSDRFYRDWKFGLFIGEQREASKILSSTVQTYSLRYDWPREPILGYTSPFRLYALSKIDDM